MPDATVYIVDDDHAVRRSLERLIHSVGLTARSFGSAGEFLQIDVPDGPCCLVTDVRMPGLSGLDLQQALQTADLDMPVIFMTGHATVPMSVRAMKAGAVDFLQKPVDDQVLLDAVHLALESDSAARETRRGLDAIAARMALLTPREREVLELVVRGRLNKQIAAELGASEKTVKVHRARVMHKMGASSLAELVRMAERAGL